MNEIFGSGLLNAGLVDLDGSLLIQLVVFGIFFIVLNILVVKPMIAAHDARYEKMEGARKEAQTMDLQAARARAEYETNLDHKKTNGTRSVPHRQKQQTKRPVLKKRGPSAVKPPLPTQLTKLACWQTRLSKNSSEKGEAPNGKSWPI
jgi:hypothetical protein